MLPYSSWVATKPCCRHGIPGPAQPAELAQLLTSLAACSSSSAAWNIAASTSGLNCRDGAHMQVAVHIDALPPNCAAQPILIQLAAAPPSRRARLLQQAPMLQPRFPGTTLHTAPHLPAARGTRSAVGPAVDRPPWAPPHWCRAAPGSRPAPAWQQGGWGRVTRGAGGSCIREAVVRRVKAAGAH